MLKYFYLFLSLIISQASANIAPVNITTPKGLKAWVYHDAKTPVIVMSFFLQVGKVAEPKGQEGITAMMLELMLRGAGDYSHEAFQAILLDKAVSIRLGNGIDGIQGSLTTLADNKDIAVDLLALVINKPRFEAAQLDQVRAEHLTYLANIQNKPEYIGIKALNKLMYQGTDYEDNLEGTKQSLPLITLGDIQKLRPSVFTKDKLVIGIAGNITPAEAAAMIDKVFGDLPQKSPLPPVKEVVANAKGEMKKIPHTAPQANIFFAQAGLKMNDPNYIKASIMMYILGAGQVSWLNDEVREKRGLAYTITANADPKLHSGLIIGNCGTKMEDAAESVRLIKQEWQRMQANGPTEKELSDAKKYLTGSFPLNFANTSNIANMLITCQMAGKNIDFFQTRNDSINACTLDDIKAVSKTILHPQSLTFVVVGGL